MKKPDSQHLDFLISQYVDGCLEGPGKKSVEQKLLTDPAARGLYAEHQEVQDLLDDWGSRIPMINWDEFDKKLATRLAHEVVGTQRISPFRRWARPVAAAAAMFIAASIGYAWHAFSHEQPLHPSENNSAVAQSASAHKSVQIENGISANRPHQQQLIVEEPAAMDLSSSQKNSSSVALSEPEDAAAMRSLIESVTFGMGNLPQSLQPRLASPKSSVTISVPTSQKDEKDNYPR